MDIRKLAEKYNDYILKERRHFHEHPELSFKEKETTAAIKKQLEEMGVPVTTFPDYQGLIGVIKGGRPGKTLMLRADIDALPVEEHTDLAYKSKNGNMHACGHDCHTAMLLGAAKILTEVKGELAGEVRLLFQSAEESCYGARYYVEKGYLDDVDAVFGFHIWSMLQAGKFDLADGGRMASCDNFKITVKGKSAHGSAPHLGRDAIVAAASVVMNLQTFASRRNDPLNSLVISIGTINGGQRFNIVADQVVMEGTIRTYSRELLKTLEHDLRQIVTGTAAALDCQAEFEYIHYLNPVINEHADLNRLARDAAVKLYGQDFLGDLSPLMGSEDFAMLMEKVPGVFGFLGCRNPAVGAEFPHHNDKFAVDEAVLQRGAALYAQFAVDYLAEKAK